MTMCKRESGKGRGKALDLWQPPEGAGEPRFCVATTFTFDAAFFEVERLGASSKWTPTPKRPMLSAI